MKILLMLAVPNVERVESKENEKIEKYQDLRQEIATLWEMKRLK